MENIFLIQERWFPFYLGYSYKKIVTYLSYNMYYQHVLSA